MRARVKLVMHFSNAFSAMPEKDKLFYVLNTMSRFRAKQIGRPTADSIHTYAYIPKENSTAVWEETKLKNQRYRVFKMYLGRRIA